MDRPDQATGTSADRTMTWCPDFGTPEYRQRCDRVRRGEMTTEELVAESAPFYAVSRQDWDRRATASPARSRSVLTTIVRRGHAPRQGANARRRGSRRGASVRSSSSDDPGGDPEPVGPSLPDLLAHTGGAVHPELEAHCRQLGFSATQIAFYFGVMPLRQQRAVLGEFKEGRS